MDDMLPISALQHYAYCPRQFALIHVEQVWEENLFTAEGRVLHQRVDSRENETRGRLRYERGVALLSQTLGIWGKMDMLEIETLADGECVYFPVEYKRGKPKVEDWDRMQLCAQALCLEEMRNVAVTEGALWYWETRRREHVCIDAELRLATRDVIAAAREVWLRGNTPAPTDKKARCRACSLKDVCKPEAFRRDRSDDYVQELLNE